MAKAILGAEETKQFTTYSRCLKVLELGEWLLRAASEYSGEFESLRQ
jgi:hypothetical protein